MGGRSDGRFARAIAAAGILVLVHALFQLPQTVGREDVLSSKVFAQATTFRASSDAMYLVATVTDRSGTLVTDLAEEEFEIREDGEPRQIVVFSRDRLPFAISIMFDISGSLHDRQGLIREAVLEFVKSFEPGDRANVGAFAALPVVSPRFSANPKELEAWIGSSIGGVGVPCRWNLAGISRLSPTPTRSLAPLVAAPSWWGTAAWDAVACAIGVVAADVETPRRVVLLVTDGKDYNSASTRYQVQEEAIEKGVMVYVVGVAGSEGVDKPGLRELAEQTGGGYLELRESAVLPATFATLAEELRHQYVFGFIGSQASQAGGRIEVVPLRPGLTARSRRVYMKPILTAASSREFAATVTVAQAPASAPSTKAPVPSLEWLERYRPGMSLAPTLSLDALWSGAGNFRRDAQQWIGAGPPGDVARRRLVVATCAVQMLANFEDRNLWLATQPAVNFLEWASHVLRQSAPLPAERFWWTAVMGLLERSAGADVLQRYLDEAEARFPHDERWTLVRAIVDEFEADSGRQDDGAMVVSRTSAGRAARHFAEAASHTSVRQEALVRWGAFDVRLGDYSSALSHLGQADRPDDPILRFWAYLWKGRAYEDAGQLSDAVECYRQALIEMPLSQSAALAYGAALVSAHRIVEAATVVRGTLRQEPGSQDAWDLYRAPDARWWGVALEQLRTALTP